MASNTQTKNLNHRGKTWLQSTMVTWSSGHHARQLVSTSASERCQWTQPGASLNIFRLSSNQHSYRTGAHKGCLSLSKTSEWNYIPFQFLAVFPRVLSWPPHSLFTSYTLVTPLGSKAFNFIHTLMTPSFTSPPNPLPLSHPLRFLSVYLKKNPTFTDSTVTKNIHPGQTSQPYTDFSTFTTPSNVKSLAFILDRSLSFGFAFVRTAFH